MKGFLLCTRSFSKYLVLLLLFNSGAILIAQAKQGDKRVTIVAKNITVKEVLNRITKQTKYIFSYHNEQVNQYKKVNVEYRNEFVEDVLSHLFSKEGLSWVRMGEVIVIRKKGGENIKEQTDTKSNIIQDTLLSKDIQGKVSDREGKAIAKATIYIKGTDRGVVANDEGLFVIKKVPRNAVLVVTAIGYEMQEQPVGNKANVSFWLNASIGQLDETVVIAYGTILRRKLTGSVGRITSKEIEKQPVSNPLQTLQGRVSGLVITQSTGVPGGNFIVQIRGQNSLRNTNVENGNNPFYVIDGVPFISTNLDILNVSGNQLYPSGPASGYSPLNSINPSDIESIEVLKDADATAIYGSRGANGVILITTKRGKAEKISVDANFYTGFSRVNRKMNLLDTKQYLEMRNEAFNNDGQAPFPSSYDVNGTWGQNRYTDWQKELIGGTANNTDAQLSISGGNVNSQYRFGGGYHRESTVFPGDFSDQRASAHISLTNTSPNKRFKSQLSVNYAAGFTNLLVSDLTTASLTLPPNAPALLDSLGNLNFENLTFANNPLAYTKRPYDAKTTNLISNATLNYELFPGITAKVSLGYTNITRKEISKNPASSNPKEFFPQNFSRFGNSTVNSWIIEPQLTWREKFGNSHLNLMIGTTFQNESIEQASQIARGFLSESLMDNIGAVPAADVTSSFAGSKYKYNAVFARVTYEFMGRYLLNLTGRRDGSSRFGPGKQFGNFGAIGAGWIFSEEWFVMSNLSFLSYGKVRGSYGITGSDQIPNYGFLNTYTTVNAGQYQGVAGLAPARLFNPNFRWETNRKFEVALELGFIQDRILLTTSYYRNKSSNQLVGYPLPPTAGFTTVQYNLDAIVQNTGIELELNTNNIRNKTVNWSSSFNISIPRNKLVSYPNLVGSSFASSYVIGEPLAIRRLYHSIGVDPQTGLYEMEDVDMNGVFNLSDQQTIGLLGPRFYGGVQNSFQFKGFQLDILFQFTKQKGNNYLLSFSQPGLLGNQPVDVMNRWQKPGDNTSIQKFSGTGIGFTEYGRLRLSDASVTDASFIRLKNLALSYSLPNEIIQKLKIQGGRISLQGQNIFTLTSYKGLDPETQGMSLPPLQTLVAGIQVTL